MTLDIMAKGLRKEYPNGAKALSGVDLGIPRGQFLTLLGPNGAGKSTLVKILTTLIAQDSGEFRIRDLDPKRDFARIQGIIGVASQENELDPGETTEGLLAFQGRLFGMPKRAAARRADELIGLFRLGDERKKASSALSGGNRRRLHCALALVHAPGIIFLDEPTVGMDPIARADFWEVITRLNKDEGVTVLLTTQYLEEADRHATEMALLIDGTIRHSGPISGFKRMVRAGDGASLEESYVEYLKALTDRADSGNEGRMKA